MTSESHEGGGAFCVAEDKTYEENTHFFSTSKMFILLRKSPRVAYVIKGLRSIYQFRNDLFRMLIILVGYKGSI